MSPVALVWHVLFLSPWLSIFCINLLLPLILHVSFYIRHMAFLVLFLFAQRVQLKILCLLPLLHIFISLCMPTFPVNVNMYVLLYFSTTVLNLHPFLSWDSIIWLYFSSVVAVSLCFPGDVPLQSDSSWSMECSPVLRVQSIYISSAILAAKSPFFYKARDKLVYDFLFLNSSHEYAHKNIVYLFIV